MPATIIIMNPPAGTTPFVHLPGGQTLIPNPDGSYSVPAEQYDRLVQQGWQLVISGSPPTHVP